MALAADLFCPIAAPGKAADSPGVQIIATDPEPGLGTRPEPAFPWAAENFIARSPDGTRVALGGMGDTGDFGLGSSFFALHLVDAGNRRSLWARAAGDGAFLSNDRFLFWGSDKLGEGELGLYSISDRKVLWTYPPLKSSRLRSDFWGIEGSWNPRSGELAVSRGLMTNGSSIWILRLRDMRLRGITRPGAAPRWSPDGKHILFTVPNDLDFLAGRVGSVRPDGTGRRSLGEGRGLGWFPDGKSALVARRSRDGLDGYELFRVVIDRNRWTSLAKVAWKGGSGGEPSNTWLSPSGRWLVYHRKGRVYVVPTFGGERVELPLESDFPPFWGLDDTMLFTRTGKGWFRSRLRFSVTPPNGTLKG